MSPVPPRRKGWCPGALRPMETGDGLLVRVRASGGRLSLDQAAAIAGAASACGNGAISLSSRGNLQIRGVSEATLPDLQAHLAAAGLLDADPEVERLRNIVVSPLSDLDPGAAFDLSPALAALESRLTADAPLRALPAKFTCTLDAGGRFSIEDVEADIRFDAVAPSFAVSLAGDDSLSVFCEPTEAGEVATRLARAFLAFVTTDPSGLRRMRALVARIGAEAVFAAAGLPSPSCGRRRPGGAGTDESLEQDRAFARANLGPLSLGEAAVVGLAAPFGALGASQFAALVARARVAGAESLRLAPQRALFVAGLTPRPAAAFAEACAALGFILDPSDLRLRVAACPGAPACQHAHAPVRDDAARWAHLLPPGEGVALHVAGCAKGCARPVATAATLVATPDGYDFVAHGRASDPPTRQALSWAAVAALIASGEAFAGPPAWP